MYKQDVKCFDEPYSPIECRKLFGDYEELSKRKFLVEENMYSYFLQCRTIHECLAGGASVFLEVGPGGNIVRDFMRGIGYNYFTLDTQEDVNPDIMCDVRNLNTYDYLESFDLVASFQMLEHIPYHEYLDVLEKIKLITKKYILLSVPYKCRYFNLHFSLSIFNDTGNSIVPNLISKIFRRLGKIHVSLILPYINLPNRRYRKEFAEEFPFAVHFWEIGRNGLFKNKFLRDIESKGFSIKKTFHNKIRPYHFFVLAEKI